MWTSQRGQTSAEYVGILAFVVGVVLIVILAAPGLGGGLVDKILHHHGRRLRKRRRDRDPAGGFHPRLV